MKLSIIIINYNCFDILNRCLDSISSKFSYEIILVDNDGKLPPLNLAAINIIPFSGNDGFSGANNRALKVAKGEYVLFLNADVFLTSSYIDECVKYLEQNLGSASVQGKLLKEHDVSLIDSTGNVVTRSYFAFNENHLSKDRAVASHEIFGVCCAAGLFRRSMLDDVTSDNQYFDEDFFAYLEDVDLNIRLRKAGYLAYFQASAVALHIREASSNFSFRFKQSMLNRYLLVVKHGGIISVWANGVLLLPALFLLGSERRLMLQKIVHCYAKRGDKGLSRAIAPRLDSDWRFLQHVFKRLRKAKP